MRVIRKLQLPICGMLIGFSAYCAVRVMDTGNWWWAPPGIGHLVGATAWVLWVDRRLYEQETDS